LGSPKINRTNSRRQAARLFTLILLCLCLVAQYNRRKMETVLPFALPLISAFVYVAGALLLKRAADLGTSPWRLVWTCNWISALVFAPLLFLGGNIRDWHQLWQPASLALLYLLGLILSFFSLKIGDVSVATPVLGLKIILVALLTTVLLNQHLSAPIWIAACISSVAVALLNATRGGHHERVGITIVLAGSAAATYALFDVLVQRWSGNWGPGRFLPIMMGLVAIYSWPLRLVERKASIFPHSARPWLWAGTICLAVQSMLFIFTVARFGEATMANILYSSRGVWSVIAVWVVGHWFRSREQHLGRRILAWRLCGAILLLIAIALVFFAKAEN
jgi:drug/metabolite transporter (DMT)-like permease